jgi:phospholipid/cholesterol/gamma-HCH transport system permease protein
MHVTLIGLTEAVDRSRKTFMHAIGGLGEMVWAQWDELRHAAAVIGTVLYVCVQPRYWVRTVREAFVRQVVAIGVDSIPLVCGVAVFVGIMVVRQLVFWIEQAGQSQMVGPLLVAVVARELGPVLIGIVVIVRSGSAMATELGIMSTDGRVHVLETQERSPFLCLVMPRVLAMAVSTFCLTIVFILVVFASGYLFGAMVGKGSPDVLLFVDTLMRAIRLKDVLAILSKSIVPALFAGASCCVVGLDVSESLTEVPQATQRALVRSLVGLFVISTVVSFLTYL